MGSTSATGARAHPDKVVVEVDPKTGTRRERTIAEVIAGSIEVGAYVEDAARAAGISPSTHYNWLARGEEHRDPGVYASGKHKGEPKPIPEAERPFVEFAEAIEKARGTAVVLAVAAIRLAWSKDWRAAAWFLERTRPKDYAQVRRHEHAAAGADGERMTFAELMASAVDGGDEPAE